ncbi:hypothetical protein SEEN6801_07778 [Salmonella enterica subsp. enterica serovar Newport str. 36801]|nr:hypothetical protein SEEN6801_07778 [Salmonella enterica subsp. enterica serovar Newport str. 36801]
MFNIIRDVEAPECLSHGIYNDPSVTDALKKYFMGNAIYVNSRESAIQKLSTSFHMKEMLF